MKKQLFNLVFMLLIVSAVTSSCISIKKFSTSEALVNERIIWQDKNALFESYSKILTAGSNLIIANQAKRLKEMQYITQPRKNVLTRLKSSVEDVLMNHKTDELSVYAKDVALDEKLQYKSGSNVLIKKTVSIN